LAKSAVFNPSYRRTNFAMRVSAGIYLALALAAGNGFASDPKNPSKHPALPALGVKTPGVRIPFADLKTELEWKPAAAPAWIAMADSILIPSKDGLSRVDPKAKESKFGEPIGGLKEPCGGLVNAFSALWVPNCGEGTLVRLDPKAGKLTAKIATGAGNARIGIAATADSIWMLTDARGTLSRIDPVQNVVVAELRVYADCNSLIFGETALWLTCPAENVVLRVDPQTNLVDKSIEVAAAPTALVAGESSIWVLGAGSGRSDGIRRGLLVGQYARLPRHTDRSARREGRAAVLRRGRRVPADHAELVVAGGHGGWQAAAPRHTPHCRHSGGVTEKGDHDETNPGYGWDDVFWRMYAADAGVRAGPRAAAGSGEKGAAEASTAAWGQHSGREA
jgi:streptogramin lyase